MSIEPVQRAHARAGAQPPRPVQPRERAIHDGAVLHLVADAAVKENAFASYSGHARGMSNRRTHLRVEVWVRNLAFAKSTWLDFHVYDRDGGLLRADTLPLRFSHAAGDGGDLFVLEDLVYQGSIATQGSVDPRPDARAVQYRVYCEQDARVYTDGVPHWCELRMDAAGG
jgi:hypothetical protein